MGLVPDVTDEHCLVGAKFQGHAVERGLEALAQPPPQDNAVSAHGHGSAPYPLAYPAPTGTAEVAPDAARSWAWAIAQAALISPMWLNACGKLPIISPLPASTSSASRPTSLMAATARSKVPTAWSSSPAMACACASQNVHSRKVPSSPARPSCAR